MPIFLVSTVRRNCPPQEPSGYLYAVDPAQGKVIQRSAIVEPLFRDLDANPRGGMRGAKGIAIRPDQLALANFSMIFRYDPHWRLLGALTHPSCAGIHDIQFEDDTLWVAAARADLLLQLDLQGRILQSFYLRDPSPAVQQLGWKAPVLLDRASIQRGATDFRHPHSVEKETYDRAHLNSLCRLENGDRLVSLGFVFDEQYASLLRLKIRLVRWGIWPALKRANRSLRSLTGKKQRNMDQNLVVKPARARSALVRIAADGRRSLALALPGITAPSHSLLALPDRRVVYLDTTHGDLLHIDPDEGRVLSRTSVAENGFLRGVTPLDRDCLLVGSRGELITFHVGNRQVLQRMQISADNQEAVYDIKELPEHYALPPLSLAEDFARQTGHADPSYLVK
ncbi:MAG: hypothetical protein ACKOC5_10915 [Chloroflexota bacterium]